MSKEEKRKKRHSKDEVSVEEKPKNQEDVAAKNEDEKEQEVATKEQEQDVATDQKGEGEEVATKEESNEDEVASLKDKIAELEDKYLRANAEFENLRKRMEKEKLQAVSYAHEQFARDLLPVIDALEIAANVSEGDDVVTKLKEGINLTIEQFMKCFEKHGISPVENVKEFDPNVHEAVMQVESKDHESGQIVQVLQKGYTIKDRILRPTMVSIAK